MNLNDILAVALRGNASDIHLKAGLPPMFRVNGLLVPLKDAARLPPEEISAMTLAIMNNFQKEKFRQASELDLAYGVPGLGRFRVNVFQQRGIIGAVFRVIPLKILTIEQLGLPKVLEQISMEQRGLILVTGTTGSGKSTTLAAMIDHINTNRTAHILTIEDPIEFLVRDKRSIVNQREIGVDTNSFAIALRSALRQDPDVILVGEMRDLETIEIALTAAETGHLVMSTVHTLDATETINRIVSAFPPHHQKAARLQLASVLRAVISQRLVPRADGQGRVAALEIMRNTGRIRELIEEPERAKEIPDAIASGTTTYGMQTFDQSLMALFRSNLISYEESLRQASNPDDFALRVSGVSATSDTTWDSFEKAPPLAAPASAATRGAPPSANAPLNIPTFSPSPAKTNTAAPAKTAVAPNKSPTAASGNKNNEPPAISIDEDLLIERF
ncbi:MAG: type IV pilus twitching motility protein PilT [Deltaproteobacteria bacterium]|nr:type IV pilus twitching motility protein PilT [Deltaproteobacteria bacterium]